MAHCFLRLTTVKARTGLSRTTLYRRIAEGSFPAPVSLGGRAVGWLDSDIDDWITLQLSARRSAVEAAGAKPSGQVAR